MITSLGRVAGDPRIEKVLVNRFDDIIIIHTQKNDFAVCCYSL
jgi:hypothetical protein